MRRVITYGVFDLFNYENIALLKQAKELGDYLVVALATDELNKYINKKTIHSYDERKEMLKACKYVDLVIPEKNLEQKIFDIQNYKVDTFVIDSQWEGEFDYLKGLCEVVYLTRKF